jgi:hypothetical protein
MINQFPRGFNSRSKNVISGIGNDSKNQGDVKWQKH